jgi:ligand-binding sensor domain-containing protein
VKAFRTVAIAACSFLAALFVAEIVNAQLPSGNWSAISSMATVNEIVRTQNIIWAATNGGVLRYDLVSRTYERFTRVDGLAGNQVLSAVVDDEGNLWFGTSGHGLSKFIVSSDRFSNPFTEFSEFQLNDLTIDGDRLYIASNVGISLFLTDVERVKENYRQFGSYPRDAAVSAVAVHEGKLWAGTESGLAWADLTEPNLQDPLAWSTDDSVGPVADFLVASDTLLAAAGERAWRWDASLERWVSESRVGVITSLGMLNGQPVALTADSRLVERQSRSRWTSMSSSGNLRTLSRDGEELWVGTYEGLAVIGDDPPPPLGDPPENHFYDMTMLAGGNLWVASIPNDQTVIIKGLYHFDQSRWWVHDNDNGIPSNLTVAVEQDRSGQLWVGTWGHGLIVLDSQNIWRHFNQSNSVLEGIPTDPNFVVVSDIQRDAEGNMWLVNIQAGLAVLDGFPRRRGHLSSQATLGLAPGRDMGKLAISPDDLKWIGTAQDGLIMFDDGGTPFDDGDERTIAINTGFDSRLGSDRVTAVYSNQTGVVWVGTDNGLNRVSYRYDRATGDFEIRSWREYGLHNGLLSPVITDIEGDADGNIWAGTKGGLTQLKTTGVLTFTYTTDNSPLIDDRVESLLFDSTGGELWIGTFDGLARLQISGETDPQASIVTAYPNPLLLSPTAGNRVTIDRLPAGSSVRIFSVDGQLVRELQAFFQETSVTWDGANASGRFVDSGIFLFVATDRLGSSTTGKFAVIRER